jgi:IS30 family transposase
LKACRSPAAIAADLWAEGATERVCAEAIYTALHHGRVEVKPSECLRRRRKHRRRRQERHTSKRPGLPNIASRPALINDRSVPGRREGDLIVGARNASAALTLIERQTRYGLLIDLPNGYTATDVLAGLCEAFDAVPAHLRHSVTFDQGSEWANWQSLAATYNLDVFFCDPHTPWQRGAIENSNGHVRFWLPRGQRLDTLTPTNRRHIESILNNQRRRNLDWASPAQLYTAATTPGALTPAA